MKKIILAIFALTSLTALTTACTSDNGQEDNRDTEIKADDSQDINTEVVNSEPVNDSPLLAINSACIGCGRCVNIDPAHFEMNGNKAIVASQDNLDSSKIQQAIDVCPAEAISI